MFANLYVGLKLMGIDVAGDSHLVGYPSQFPDVSMMNWINAKPNARYWVLKLLINNFGPGDQLYKTSSGYRDIVAQGFVTTRGKRVLLFNTRNRDMQIQLPKDISDAEVLTVDGKLKPRPAIQTKLSGDTVTLTPFAATVIQIK